MRMSERGQFTIPKRLREQFGLDHNVEIEITPTDEGLLIRRCDDGLRPIDKVYGIPDRPGIASGLKFDSVDAYIEEIRGR